MNKGKAVKITKIYHWTRVIIIAAIGVFCGAALSNGMMDIARHGIFVSVAIVLVVVAVGLLIRSNLQFRRKQSEEKEADTWQQLIRATKDFQTEVKI